MSVGRDGVIFSWVGADAQSPNYRNRVKTFFQGRAFLRNAPGSAGRWCDLSGPSVWCASQVKAARGFGGLIAAPRGRGGAVGWGHTMEAPPPKRTVLQELQHLVDVAWYRVSVDPHRRASKTRLRELLSLLLSEPFSLEPQDEEPSVLDDG
jgi:hypothetical protein